MIYLLEVRESRRSEAGEVEENQPAVSTNTLRYNEVNNCPGIVQPTLRLFWVSILKTTANSLKKILRELF